LDNVEYDEEGWPIRVVARHFSWVPQRPGFVVRHCNMCEEPFTASFEHDAVCPHCRWLNRWSLIAVRNVKDDLRPGERLGLVNARSGEEIFVVRCVCGRLFDYPPGNGRVPLVPEVLSARPSAPGSRSCELARGISGTDVPKTVTATRRPSVRGHRDRHPRVASAT
jgi:hypothetical protein